MWYTNGDEYPFDQFAEISLQIGIQQYNQGMHDGILAMVDTIEHAIKYKIPFTPEDMVGFRQSAEAALVVSDGQKEALKELKVRLKEGKEKFDEKAG